MNSIKENLKSPLIKAALIIAVAILLHGMNGKYQAIRMNDSAFIKFNTHNGHAEGLCSIGATYCVEWEKHQQEQQKNPNNLAKKQFERSMQQSIEP